METAAPSLIASFRLDFFVEARIGGKAAPVSFRCQEETTNATTARSRRARCGLVVFAVMNLSTRVNRAGDKVWEVNWSE